jgi:hypothetical protein
MPRHAGSVPEPMVRKHLPARARGRGETFDGWPRKRDAYVTA